MVNRGKLCFIDGLRLLYFAMLGVCFGFGHAEAAEFTVYVGKVAPFTMVAEDGAVTGAAMDLMETVMERADSPIDRDKVRSISWARAVYEVEHTPQTMIFGMARTPQREDKFKWVGPIAELNLGLVARKEPRIEILNKSQVAGYRVGVVRNSAPMQILENEYEIPQSKQTLLPSDQSQFKMLHEGRVDMITQADTAAPDWLVKLSMDQNDYEMVHVMKHLKLYAAFNSETDDAFIAKAQAALNAIKAQYDGKRSEYDCIVREYLEEGPISIQK